MVFSLFFLLASHLLLQPLTPFRQLLTQLLASLLSSFVVCLQIFRHVWKGPLHSDSQSAKAKLDDNDNTVNTANANPIFFIFLSPRFVEMRLFTELDAT